MNHIIGLRWATEICSVREWQHPEELPGSGRNSRVVPPIQSGWEKHFFIQMYSYASCVSYNLFTIQLPSLTSDAMMHDTKPSDDIYSHDM